MTNLDWVLGVFFSTGKEVYIGFKPRYASLITLGQVSCYACSFRNDCFFTSLFRWKIDFNTCTPLSFPNNTSEKGFPWHYGKLVAFGIFFSWKWLQITSNIAHLILPFVFTDFKKHQLPLARIKRIMKLNREVEVGLFTCTYIHIHTYIYIYLYSLSPENWQSPESHTNMIYTHC